MAHGFYSSIARRTILLSALIAILVCPAALFATGNGTATCTINPSEARSAGARWRLAIDYAPYTNWLASGNSITISNITTQGTTVQFKDVPSWSRPFFQQVTLVENKTTNITVSYQSQSNKVWTKQWGSNVVYYMHQVAGVAVDGSGYAYVMGYARGSIDGNPLVGGYDLFLTKWSPSGAKMWTQIWGSPDDEGYEVSGEPTGGVALDGNGSVYVVASTEGYFGAGQTNAGYSDCCLTKLNTNGVVEWTRMWGSTNRSYGGDFATALAVQGSNIYVCGYTIGSFHAQPHADQTQYDMFLTKWHSDGNYEWSRIWGDAKDEQAYAVEVDVDGNCYVAGTCPNSGYAVNTGPRLTKFNSSGTQQWMELWAYGLYGSALGSGTPQGLVVDGSGNIYVSGYCDGAWSNYFDGVALPSSLQALFLTKWTPSRTKLWTKVWGSANEDRGGQIARGSDGRLYIAGYTYKVANYGDADAFLTVWDTNDAILLTHIWGSTNSYGDQAYAVAVTPTGEVYVAGNTYGSMDGNPSTLSIFITKWMFPCPSPFGSVSCSITPAAAVSAGAQWKLLSGPDTGWKSSGATIANIPVGSYKLAFLDLSGWAKPPTTTVSVAAGQTTSTNGTYVQQVVGSASCSILPPEAAS
ncbi:MAG TPA: hypothetical protein PLE77_00840, partial [Kiritimatiellia bacterium]|nr:hypothetical protein [Kiritimatiellia bacterium]